MKRFLLPLSLSPLFLCAQVEFEQKNIEEYNTSSARGNFHIDFDGDGDMDILGASNGFGAFLLFENDGIGNFSTHIIDDSEEFSRGAYDIASADLDSDSDMDVVGVMSDAGFPNPKLVWFENIGSYNFTPHLISTPSSYTTLSIEAISLVDLNSDGDVDILTANRITNSFEYFENNGEGTFERFVINDDNEYANRPYDVDYIDMDNDGDIDVIGTLFRSPKYLWFENDGNENFTPHVIEDEYLLIDGAQSIDAGDVDSDGDIDLVGASGESRRILWFENDGSQNFTTKIVEYDNQYTYGANKVEFADMDKDGDLDIVASNRSSFWSGLYWFENDGTANPSNRFRDSFDNSSVVVVTNSASTGGGANREIDVVDIDNDGNIDVYASSNTTFHWFKNDGSSKQFLENFTNNTFLLSGINSIESGDIDGDGDLDFISAQSNSFAWHENQGNNTYSNHLIDDSPRTHGSKSVQLLDLDDDGDLDLIAAAENVRNSNPYVTYNGAYVWYENDGLGNFEYNLVNDSNTYARNAHSITAADVDGDGDLDLIGASNYLNNKFILFRNDGDEEFTPELIINTSEDLGIAYYVETIDLDQDGDIDVLGASRDNDIFVWFENDGAGNFSTRIIDDSSDYSNGAELIKAADIDNDGDIDVVTQARFSKNIGWFENDGNENFSYNNIPIPNEFPYYFQIANIDGKNGPDLIFSSETGLWQFVNDANGSFRRFPIDENEYAQNTSYIGLADFSSNGAVDFVIVKSGVLRIYDNKGIKNQLYGKINLDSNANGCDPSDISLKDIMVTSENGIESKTVFTNSNGEYHNFLDTGNYTTTVSSQLPTYFSPTPNEYSSSFDSFGNIQEANFCYNQDNALVNDLNITLIPKNAPRPGFGLHYEIVFQNMGTTNASGSIELNYDERLSFYSASDAYSQSGGNLYFNFTDLGIFEKRSIYVTFTVPLLGDINLGDVVENVVNVNPTTGDYTEEDNTFFLKQTVIGSYDPNDITVLEGDTITPEQAEDYLNYRIRFQNTGTASAINVRIEHELDDKSDWTTFTPLSSSHDNTINITNGKDVEFLFENINLPDSTSNEPASHGYVAFKIKPKSDAVVGDVISGVAGIYFDFNPPIITNTVSTQIVDNEPLLLTATVSGISCTGSNDATILAEAAGGAQPYLYELLDGTGTIVLVALQSSNLFEGLGVGNYIVRVQDVNGDTAEISITISEPAPIQFEAMVTNVSCEGAASGSIEINAIGGTGQYLYAISPNLNQFSYEDNFTDLSAGTYTILVQDSNGCFLTQEVVIADETSNDTDFDQDGIKDQCDDDIDGDGVLNAMDQCPQTANGATVDSNGCETFTLPANNFAIQNVDETCAVSNDGSISVSAIQNLPYSGTLSLDGVVITTQNFTTRADFRDLEAGTYELCIDVDGYSDYQKCFALVITEPEGLEVNGQLDSSARTVTLKMSGGSSYTVTHNNAVYNTSKSELTLELDGEVNVISVKTDQDCQGSYKETLLLEKQIQVFPNPVTNQVVHIVLDATINQGSIVSLYTLGGSQLLLRHFDASERQIDLQLPNVPPGTYMLMVAQGSEVSTEKIIVK